MTKVLTFGVFDYFHIGHLRLFKRCKEYGDYLIVGVQDDAYVAEFKENPNPFYSTEERLEMVKALRIVDETFVYDILCTATMEKTDFDILALGEMHIGERFDEIEKWCKDKQKSVIRLKRTPGISSSKIKKEVAEKCGGKQEDYNE